MGSKIFSNEIEKLFNRLKNREKFSFSKFADGEWMMMNGVEMNNNEFTYNNEDSFYRDKLIEAFKYKDDKYIIGISCPCCQGDDHFKMKEFSESDDDHLTFANIFVNDNYQYYKDNFLNEYKNFDVHLVANKYSNINKLPFKIEKFYPVENTAWKHNYGLIEEIKKCNYKDKLFLFACGPFGNMLAHQLWDSNKENTYLDIGSTLNPWLESEGFKRDYYLPNTVYSKQICVWS